MRDLIERDVEDRAKVIFERRWGDEKRWAGRSTNRAYYRRIARGELTRALKAKTPDSEKEKDRG